MMEGEGILGRKGWFRKASQDILRQDIRGKKESHLDS